MSNLLNEHRLTLAELARREGVSVCTVWRWAQRGARGAKLETFAVGGRRYTTEEAHERFARGCTEAIRAPTQVRSNRQRNAAIAQAERELKSAGF
ncbi:MAG: hypothetical protein C0485_18035 [Pirellula sp.]|nr:hypothetical protein [Pirellula sp.]